MVSSLLITLTDLLLILSSFAPFTNAANATEWRSRSIYQIVTDRFALSNGSTSLSCDPGAGKYCGGSFEGITRNLDYIQNMGFDAIWISPVTAQVEGMSKDLESYHGYWQTDLYSINHHFGTADDLKNLSDALHARDMYLMVDVVVNNMAYKGAQANVNYSSLYPFNKKSYYHDPCFITNSSNSTNVQQCWLGDNVISLPDLKTESKGVYSSLYTWISSLVSNYSIDGLRIDSASNVNHNFWDSFTSAADVFATGEIYDTNYQTCCQFQELLPSILNYPLWLPMTMAFNATNGSIANLAQTVLNVKNSCKDSTLLGTFAENHDVPRFSSYTSDMSLAKNILTFTILSDGIPIVYYGQEQHASGRINPLNRPALWRVGYKETSSLYEHISTLNSFRHHVFNTSTRYSDYKAYPIYNDSEVLVLRKGFDDSAVITLTTNQGHKGDKRHVTIDGTGYSGSSSVVEVLTCTNFTTHANGSLTITIQKGQSMVWYPAKLLQGWDGCENFDNATGDGETQDSSAPRTHNSNWFWIIFLMQVVLIMII